MSTLLDMAGVKNVPLAVTAVFVGTEFDSITGRGGNDGTPVRKTPWGEIAWQLSGTEGLKVVEEHEKQLIAPAGDVIRQFLPKDRPYIILLDELMNYVSRNRKSGLSMQLYNFMQNLSEVIRSEDRAVLVVSIPASEMEMNSDDQQDYSRLKKLLDRLGKAVFMSSETETSEIIRRRLFEWDLSKIGSNGKINISKDAMEVCKEYEKWVLQYKQQIPGWFSADNAREVFASTYPFHPMVLSVFERKWQALPRFQQTRGVLRLLALWVSKAYQEGYKGAHKDSLINLGTAPLEDSLFRAAVFEQLGESRLEAAITTDICGKNESHSVRLDKEAVDAIKKDRLHRKIATVILFESNGGQIRDTEATLPEIRLAVAEPSIDIGNIETSLESLASVSYYLSSEKNRYRFSIKPNLNKLLSDRRASIQPDKIASKVKEEIKKVFDAGTGMDRVYFPEKSNQIQDRPALTLIILSPEHTMEDKNTMDIIENMTKEHGTSARTFKSALIWVTVDSDSGLREEARKVLAWQDIEAEEDDLKLDESQKKELNENLKKSMRDLKECVWRSYKNIVLLGKDNNLRVVDLGLIHSSAASNIITLIINRLRQDGDIEDVISPTFLVRHWPPAFKEWPTRAVRDAFFASPQFPRLLKPDTIKETIVKGITNKVIGYVGKMPDGKYDPFHFGEGLFMQDVEISDDMYIITASEALRNIEPPKLARIEIIPKGAEIKSGEKYTFTVKGFDQHERDFPVDDVKWDVTGGTIDEKGVYHAGEDGGSFIVVATAGILKSTIYITIKRPQTGFVEPPTGSGDPPLPLDPPSGPKKLSWSGTITPHKWMNFYQKVLSKYHSNETLNISVCFDVVPDGELSLQRVEEIKAALRELGMGDDVIVS